MAENTTQHTDPYRRCTCGWRRFREYSTQSGVNTEVWAFINDTESGAGSTPAGLGAGGSGGVWGRVNPVNFAVRVIAQCENCTRIRNDNLLFSGAFVGWYQQDEFIYVLGTGIEGVGCFSLEFRGSVTLTANLKISSDPMEPANSLVSPLEVASSPPAGAEIASDLLSARIPSAPIEGDYTVVLVDRCGGNEVVLGTVSLEVDVIVLNPGDVDLNGAPELWLQDNWMADTPASQPQAGVAKAIPFDKCTVVAEYDARFGVKPDNIEFGFSYGGTGSETEYTLVDGGVLSVVSPGAGVLSYWTKNIVLTTPVDRVYSYARYLPISIPTGSVGTGLDFQGRFSDTSDVNWRGSRFTVRDSGLGMELYYTLLNGSSDKAWPAPDATAQAIRSYSPKAWQRTAHAFLKGSPNMHTWHNQEYIFWNSGLGTLSGAPLEDRLEVVFGNTGGGQVTAYIRNFVVSAPGRFIRAWFRGFATITAPVLRMYMTGDLDASGPTARFKVRYGQIGPYSIPVNEANVTASFITRNSPTEVTVSLPGLTAFQPFWFTVERDWTHADDVIDSTVWLVQATVRGA